MKAKLLIFVFTALSLATLFLFTPKGLALNPLGTVCKQAPTNPTCQQNSAQNSSKTNPVVKIIRAAANLIALIAGIAAVIVIIISGFMFVTAGGASPGQRGNDPNKVKSARAALTGAIIGLVVIALAWTLVTFVTNRLIG